MLPTDWFCARRKTDCFIHSLGRAMPMVGYGNDSFVRGSQNLKPIVMICGPKIYEPLPYPTMYVGKPGGERPERDVG
jgi:hypothetical protein